MALRKSAATLTLAATAPAPIAPVAVIPSAPPTAGAEDWSARGPLLTGIFSLVFLLGGIGVWSVRTNISGAVVAPGMIQVESNRQVIQHQDGGVVSAILARDGDLVKPGDILMRLDGTRLNSELAVVDGQLQEISARQARLLAERNGQNTVTFDADLLKIAASDGKVQSQVEGERNLFTTRREALAQEVGLLGEQNAQIDNRITGTEAQLAALHTQIDILDRELANQQRLLDQQLTQAGRVLELRRMQADLQGQIGRLMAEIAEFRGQSASNAISLLKLETTRREEAATALRDLEFSQIELTERKLALQDTLSRLDIRAPMGGIVYNSQVFALQAVIQPAQPIMYIVPQDQPLVVTARVSSINVDEVFVGQEVALRFSSFDQRKMPDIMGQIQRISADVIVDEATRQSYYSAEVVPLASEMAKLGERVLLPGMPVEAYIKTSDRTALAYLIQPMRNFFDKAFRE